MQPGQSIIEPRDLILITGATGFIGSRVVSNLLDRGFRNLRCFARHSSPQAMVEALSGYNRNGARVETVTGNLLSPEDCNAAARGAKVIFHLAAGTGEKSVPEAFRNSVVTTRNLLDACVRHDSVERFVNVSSFAVYSNRRTPRGRVLDESSPVEEHPERLTDAYSFAKIRQDELVFDYAKRHGLRYVIVRPGYVMIPGRNTITGRVGTDTFGLFLHLGGSNRIPFTFVDNCAEAIVLAGLTPGVEGEVFNVVDDNLPSSRQYLRQYKRNVRRFRSIYVPHFVSYALCWAWERYSAWSEQQVPPAFSRRVWHASWKKTRYSNAKLKRRLGWAPAVPMSEGLRRYFEGCRNEEARA
ncbi:MAG: NAD-dependent epimerase/dehydratase family protein [Terriglobia bacterium]